MWKFWGGALFVVACLAILVWVLFTTYPRPPTTTEPHTQPPLPAQVSYLPFLSPNRTKRLIDEEYTSDNIGYEVEQGDSTFDQNGNRQSAQFIITYDNLLNAPQTYSQAVSDAINIGCIAAHDTTYKTDPSLLYGSSLSETVHLAGFESKQVTITVPGDCQYIGTNDGRFWWYSE